MPHNHREQKKEQQQQPCMHSRRAIDCVPMICVLLVSIFFRFSFAFSPIFRMRCNDTNINVDCIMLNRFIFGVPICIGVDVYCRSLSLFHYIYQI